MNRLFHIKPGFSLLLSAMFCTFPVQAAWEITFEDNFDGTSLDATKWNPTGWVDNDYELQTYRQENVEVSNGTCKLWIKKEPYNGKEYTSGKITTGSQNTWKFSQKYGRFECRMKLPKGKAMWPAFWLLPANPYSWPPEIDIMESWGFSNTAGPTTVKSGVWCGGGSDCSGNSASKAEAAINPGDDPLQGFHVYAMEWDAAKAVFYFDAQQIGTVTQYITQYSREMWVLVQLALCNQSWGGGPPDAGTVFPANLEVDYVKVYKWSTSTKAELVIHTMREIARDHPASAYTIRGQLAADYSPASKISNIAGQGVLLIVPSVERRTETKTLFAP